VEGGALTLAQEAPRAELIVLAAPARACARLLTQVGELASPGAVVTDVASSKREIARAMDRLPQGVGAVGGHPMAGSERSGVEAADPRLFEGAAWALTPTARTDPHARELCERLVSLCGARPLWTDAGEHDRAVTAISHLPLLTAAALVLAAEREGSELAWELAASGFRDSTRVAAGDPDMGADILLSNADAVAGMREVFEGALSELLGAAQVGDEDRLRGLLARAADRRRAMYGGAR
jgi:prephenate dehydrogenase